MTVTADDSKWKESVKDSTDVEIADNCMEEKNDDDSQFPENSESHTCSEEGAKKCKKRKNNDSLSDSLSETEQKESDRDLSDQEIADDGLEEKKQHVTKIYSVSFRFPLWSPVASSVLSCNRYYRL